ncbi:hypothetical protein [Xanthomonas sp. D-109]|uniref:hypothetical protein n=1 Tax=Xanthomonas sp. D-109 TaxID=2821274 RepID=UPI001ADCAE3F|nr:hypothetical protein [Xanthomonas sp. D-109]MBO9880834.1 hypothetical protein [Xanthomonas sp. D-109]
MSLPADSFLSEHAVVPPVAQHRHVWQHAARAGFQVQVSWTWREHGRDVEGEVRDLRGGEAVAFALSLTAGAHKALLMLTHAPGRQPESFIDVTLQLVRESEAVALMCNLPLDDSRYLMQRIGDWRTAVPDRPDDDADEGAGEASIIQAQARAEDLFPFVWMQPPSPSQAADAALRFLRCPDALLKNAATAMPLYAALQAAADATAKIAAARQFRAAAAFVPDVKALGATVAAMPALAAQLRRAGGEWPLPELSAYASAALGLPAGTTPAVYLAGSEWQAAEPRLWQSVFALALVGAAADAELAAELIAVLRVGRLLALLPAPVQAAIATPATADPEAVASAAPDPDPDPASPNPGPAPTPFPPAPPAPSPQHASVRQALLHARVVVPDAVATQPPQPALRGTSADAQARWEVLGVGELKMARHRLAGYAPGELADVVNVMPRERQEVSERSVERHVERTRTSTVETQVQEQRQLRSASSELADSIAEVMAADGLGRNLSGVQPSYENLNMQLSGTWAGAAAKSGWRSRDSASLAQRITERAARRMNDRVSQRRGQEWHALREQRRAQSIDNSGHGRLVGVYRWIDRMVQVRLDSLGGRLVLEFELAQPAQPWLAQLRQAATPPLPPPPSLPLPESGKPPCSVVTADNYLALGATYGVFDLEPPPPLQCTVSATLDRVALADLGVLRVPEGYEAQTAWVTLAVADSRYVMACSIGGHDASATSPTALPALSAAVPAYATATAAGPAQIAPPVVIQPYQKTQQLSGLTLTGAVPVTVMTSAPAFAVCVSLDCVLIGGAAASSLFQAWQLRQFARLQRACGEAWAAYDAALHACIDTAAVQPLVLQRQVLQQACLGALLPALPVDVLGPRELEAVLDAAHMTWQYQAWPLDSIHPWPMPAPGQAQHASQQESLQGFLQARSARVLMPVAAGWEAWLLWLLQCPAPWAGGPADTPVVASSVGVLETLHGAAERPPEPAPRWTVRIPTTLLYLQDGAGLPMHMRQESADDQ